jgi:hypothetical protein
MKKAGIASFFGLIALVSLSCLDEPECIGLNNNLTGITFKNLSDSKSRTVDGLTITAENAAVELISGASASKVLLPLNYLDDTTSYTVQINDSTYVLILGYTSQSQFVSQDCGERFVISNLHVIEHSFDSVRLVNATPGVNEKASNIEIFW